MPQFSEQLDAEDAAATAGPHNRSGTGSRKKRGQARRNRNSEDAPAAVRQLDEEEAACPQMKAILAELLELRAELCGRPVEHDKRMSMMHSAFYSPDMEPEMTFCKASTRTSAACASGGSGSAMVTVAEWVPPVQVELQYDAGKVTNPDSSGAKEDLWTKRVVPARDKDRRDLQVGETDYEVCELFLRRLQEELQLGYLEKADELKLSDSEESETFEYFFTHQIPGLRVTVAGYASSHGDDHAISSGRSGKPWRELSGLKVEIVAKPLFQGAQKLDPNEAGALWRGCTVNHVEDTWALIEAVVQVVALSVDDWCLPKLARDENEVRPTRRHILESRNGVARGTISLTAAPRACDAHACHEESVELWLAVAGQGVPGQEQGVVPSHEQGKRSTAVEEAIRRLRHRPNFAPAGCQLLHHALQLRRTVVFEGGPTVSGPSAKAGRKFTGPVLLLALQLGEVSVVKKLLSSGADPNATYMEHHVGRYKAHATFPLMFAALESEKGNSKELLQCMLAYRADINARAVVNCYVHGTLLWAICWSNRNDAEDILCFLLDKKADLETSNGWCVDHPPMYLDGTRDRTGDHSDKRRHRGASAKQLARAKTLQSSGTATRKYSHAPTTVLAEKKDSTPALPLEFCPGRKYTALGGAVVKGARKLVKTLVDAKAEVTRHELRIAITISNAFLVRVISCASASGKKPEEALLLLKDFNPKDSAAKEDNKSNRCSISDVCVQQPQKERLRYVGDVSQVHKDLLSEMLNAIVTNPYAVQKLQQLVRESAKDLDSKGPNNIMDPANKQPCFVSRLIRHSPEAAGLLLDKIYFQEPECPSGNPVPVQCFLDSDQRMNTVYIEHTKWQQQCSFHGRSHTLSLVLHGAEELLGMIAIRVGHGEKLRPADLKPTSDSSAQKPRVRCDSTEPRARHKRFTFSSAQEDTFIELDVKHPHVEQENGSAKATIKIVDLQAGEPVEKTLNVGESEVKFELRVECPQLRLPYNGQDEDEDGEMDEWQLELLGLANSSRKHRQFCEIRILHIKQIIRLELFNAISSVPRTERLELLQSSEALQAVIHYTWVTWARPQHLVLLIWSAIRVIGLLIWVVFIPMRAKDVVSPRMCETVVMVCWAQFAAFAFLEISDNLAAFWVEWKLARVYGLRNSRSTLSNADWYDWLKDGLVFICAVDGWGSWETCSYARHHSVFAAALLICCYHFLHCMRPFRGLGYALVPILDTLSPATAETGKVSNLSAMLIIVTFLVTAIGLFAVVEFGDGEEGVWPIFVKTFMNVIVGEAELIDLETFSDTQFGVVATMGAFFGIGVVLMNIFIAVVGNSYDEMLKYNLGSFLDRRNQICEKAVLLRRICLQYTARFVSWSGPLGAPDRKRGPSCLFGLVTQLQATLLKQVWIVSCVIFALVGAFGFLYQMDVEPLLIFVSIIVIMTAVKCAGILCHTLEPPGGIKGAGSLWFVPKCYVWAAKCPKAAEHIDLRRQVPVASPV